MLIHCKQVPFPAISYCPELLTVIDDFDYEGIVDAINNEEIKITDLSDEKYVD